MFACARSLANPTSPALQWRRAMSRAVEAGHQRGSERLQSRATFAANPRSHSPRANLWSLLARVQLQVPPGGELIGLSSAKNLEEIVTVGEVGVVKRPH